MKYVEYRDAISLNVLSTELQQLRPFVISQ